MRSGGFDQGIPGFPQAWHADDEHMPQRLMAARLRVEQFKIGAFARQGGGQRQIVASRKSSPQVMMSKGGRSTLNARPSAVRNFGSAASSPAKKSTPNICSRPIRRFGSYPTVSLRPMVSNDAELYAPHTGAHPRIGCRTARRRQTQPRLPHCFQWPRSVASTRHLRNRR
mgnify:CR=1 FL=1